MTPLTIADVRGLRQHGTEVRTRLAEIAENRGWSADGMAAAIAHESGWNPAIWNPNRTAVGLIQFQDAAARTLGTTMQKIARMPAAEQLGLAERFWEIMSAGRPVGPRDWLVLGLGTGNVPMGYRSDLPDSTELYPAGSPGARGNPGMQDPDGSLTVGGARRALDAVLSGNGRLPIVAELDPLAEHVPPGAGKVVAAAAGAELVFWLGVGALALLKLVRRPAARRAA